MVNDFNDFVRFQLNNTTFLKRFISIHNIPSLTTIPSDKQLNIKLCDYVM